jgi:hypothetical protein
MGRLPPTGQACDGSHILKQHPTRPAVTRTGLFPYLPATSSGGLTWRNIHQSVRFIGDLNGAAHEEGRAGSDRGPQRCPHRWACREPGAPGDGRGARHGRLFCGCDDRHRVGERLILGGHAATCWESARNPGYHSRNVASQSPFKTRVRICSRRWAPRGVQAICCFLQKRLLTT